MVQKDILVSKKATFPSFITISLLGKQILNKWFRIHNKCFKIGPGVEAARGYPAGH